MQNKYRKICAKCNTMVEPYKGICEKVGNQWIVEHVNCHAPEVEEKDDATHPAFQPMDAFQWMEDDFELGTF